MSNQARFICVGAASVFCLLATAANAAQTTDEDVIIVAEARNTPPGFPTIRVVKEKLWGKHYPMVSATFPNVPDFTCDAWCYESPVELKDARALENGVVEMRHRASNHPGALIITTITPEQGAIEINARMAPENKDAVLPDTPVGLNLCWQLRHALGFASEPDPYPEFAKRCFLFTRHGRKSLLELQRNTIPVRPAEHEYNDPPWVQMYVGLWQTIPPRAEAGWADYSTDRYTTTIIGAVSRDGEFLTAIANDSASTMCQAWHDCMHNNPQWLPSDAPIQNRFWRVKIYAMENDPRALLKRVGEDFENAKHVTGAETVPAGRP